MLRQFKRWSPWDPVKSIMLGSCYSEKFFEPVKNKKLRESLQKICIETNEDIDRIERMYTDMGVQVTRTLIDESETIEDYLDESGAFKHKAWKPKSLVPRPPIMPRDCQVVIGEHMFVNLIGDRNMMKSLFNVMEDPIEQCIIPVDHGFKGLHGGHQTLIGNRLYLDTDAGNYDPEYNEKFKRILNEYYPQIEVHQLEIGGHNDCCFHPCKPGVLISLNDIQNYDETFPGWDIHYIENSNLDKVEGWLDIKDKNKGRWWVPGEEKNDEFADFVETWLTEWVGYVEETVFDVNVHMVNPETVMVNSYNKELFSYFETHKIQPIIAPFRHRHFWDGGVHCMTLDLYREGECEDYFSQG